MLPYNSILDSGEWLVFGEVGAYADTRYSYDVLGNLTEVKKSQASNDQSASILWQTTMSYDAAGRKTAMADPDMREWSYIYDSAGNLARQEHRTGTTVHHATCFYYDNLNRLLNRANDDTPANACPANAPTNGANYLAGYVYGTSKANRNIGKPVEVNWGAIPTENRDTFTYDAEGRLGTQTRKVNNQTFAYEVTVYDVLDRPTSVELPGGEVITTTYDEEGVNTLAAGATSLISKVGYNERGQLTLLERPGAGPETTLSYYGEAKNFRLSGITTDGSTDLPDFSYGAYDAGGNLTQFTAGADNYTYTYDEQNRLKTVTGAIGRDYTYDLLGNFDSVTRGSTLWDYTYASGNASRLMSVTNLPLTVDAAAGYDTWGNLRKYTLQGVAYELTFDAENRLASLKKGTATTTFAYDADGQRVQTTYPDGTIVYTPFPDYEVEDPLGSGANTVRTTYRLAKQIVAVQTKVGTAAGTFYYTYTDHLGNITALSTTGGAYVAGSKARYDPFGTFTTTTPTSNPSISNHGFTGHRHNNTGTNDLDLIFMNARYYMPLVGRFISPDSIVPEPTNPQSFNRYSYVNNNPINFTDPTGHCTEPASFTICVTGAIALGPVGVGIIVGGTVVVGIIAIASLPDAMEFLDNISQQVNDQVTYHLSESKSPKPLTKDEETLVGRIDTIPDWLDEHPDLAEDAEKVARGETLPKGRDHIKEAKERIGSLDTAIEHLSRVRKSRDAGAQAEIDAALERAREYRRQLLDIVGDLPK